MICRSTTGIVWPLSINPSSNTSCWTNGKVSFSCMVSKAPVIIGMSCESVNLLEPRENVLHSLSDQWTGKFPDHLSPCRYSPAYVILGLPSAFKAVSWFYSGRRWCKWRVKLHRMNFFSRHPIGRESEQRRSQTGSGQAVQFVRFARSLFNGLKEVHLEMSFAFDRSSLPSTVICSRRSRPSNLRRSSNTPSRSWASVTHSCYWEP